VTLTANRDNFCTQHELALRPAFVIATVPHQVCYEATQRR